MKKMLALLLALVLTLSMLSSCGSPDTSTAGEDSSASGSSSDSLENSNDSNKDSSDNSDFSRADSGDSSDSSDSSVSGDTSSSNDVQTITGNRRPVGTYTPSGSRQLPIYNVDTSEKICAISFDAAWGADQTENILAILDEYHVKATFFLVGRWVDEFPEMVKKISDAGHDVMNHSNTHADLATLSYDKIIEEIETCNDKIEAITGVRPALIRLPYGSYNDTVIKAVRSLGMEPIQWDVDSLDWKDGITSDDIYNKIVDKSTNGSIILCHNAGLGTPGALPDIFKTMLNDGFEFTTIYNLILKDDYTIDATGKQKTID